MLAERMMVTELVTAQVDESVGDVLARMRSAGLRMLPVLNADRTVAGVLSTFSILSYIVPNYIGSGDLKEVAYAPDMGVLRKKHHTIIHQKISDVMEKAPLLVHPHESLLSVSASLIAFGKHEYALVVDENSHLLGVISAGDVLDLLCRLKEGEVNDA